MNEKSVKSPGFVRVFVLPLCWLFLLPIVSVWFTRHGSQQISEEYLEQIRHSIDSDPALSLEQKQGSIAAYESFPPFEACGSNDPDVQPYRTAVCDRGSDLWQFDLAKSVADWSLGLASFTLVACLVLAALAFANRNAQLFALRFGWKFLRIAGALQTILQGALAVWLSFWVTALFFHFYAIKLILLAAGGAVLLVWLVVAAFFRRIESPNFVEGELLKDDEAPALRDRVAHICQKLGIESPKNFIVGIDENFFVTEAPLSSPFNSTSAFQVEGRSLYMSLSLLKVMNREQAEAVLAHEMAHFQGGDVEHSSKLGPELDRFGHYLREIHGVFPVYSLMLLFRGLLELAFAKERREREFRADAVAAQVVSPQAFGEALLKVNAYASYRDEVERELFSSKQKLETVGIAERVSIGFADYASTNKLIENIHQRQAPHPFDSHPPFEHRLRALGTTLAKDQYRAILEREVEDSWFSDLTRAGEIEAQLWQAYEARFALNHELSLAYRYAPSNAAEQALVEKYFPERSFANKDGGNLVVNHRAFTFEDGQSFEFSRVESLALADETFAGRVLVIKMGDGKERIVLKKFGDANMQNQLVQTMADYLARHKFAHGPEGLASPS